MMMLDWWIAIRRAEFLHFNTFDRYWLLFLYCIYVPPAARYIRGYSCCLRYSSIYASLLDIGVFMAKKQFLRQASHTDCFVPTSWLRRQPLFTLLLPYFISRKQFAFQYVPTVSYTQSQPPRIGWVAECYNILMAPFSRCRGCCRVIWIRRFELD